DRIANQVFDDPPRVLPPEPEKAKVALEMDDKKSHKGLGDIYEEEFVAATASGASTAVDKQDAVRQEAKNLMKELFGKLDALSHFHYAPKPVIEEMQVRADVPALAMEEVAPQVASEAAMRAPEEVYKAQQQGAPQAAEELSREERTRLRAKKKRAGKKRKQQEELQSSKPQSNIIGQKSEKALVAASGKKGKKGKASAQAPADKDSKISYSKSGSVFKRMQEQKEAAAAGLVPSLGHGDTDGPVRKKAAALKL
ncbi:MAG: U3 small nucleolar ribonucleo, partial [Trebouxia sp. A1-2]